MSKALGTLDLTLSGADPAIGLPRSELVVADVVLAPTSAEYPLHTWTLLPAAPPPIRTIPAPFQRFTASPLIVVFGPITNKP